ncbi:MAG: VOC family protein [Bacteroidota bacterium]|nr:VOC family protein [Bacteroidota bacterium]
MTNTYGSITPYLVIRNAEKAIDFYKKAFGAKEITRLMVGDKVGHAELLINNSRIMLADEFPEWGMSSAQKIGDSPVIMLMSVNDADAVFNRAVAEGAKAFSRVELQFYGDRSGTLIDPFGHKWTISSHAEDISEEEMKKRAAGLAAP